MKPHAFAQMVNEIRDRVSDLLGRYINANNVI